MQHFAAVCGLCWSMLSVCDSRIIFIWWMLVHWAAVVLDGLGAKRWKQDDSIQRYDDDDRNLEE